MRCTHTQSAAKKDPLHKSVEKIYLQLLPLDCLGVGVCLLINHFSKLPCQFSEALHFYDAATAFRVGVWGTLCCAGRVMPGGVGCWFLLLANLP